MVRVVSAQHFLVDGDLPPEDSPLRRYALAVARLIEYAGPVPRRHARETLIECSRRPKKRNCRGLLWVRKTDADEIEAFCPKCESLHYVISDWKETVWAEGPMEPLGPPSAKA
jgi:hypothetical protein